jgi:hypothetical protein
MDLKGKQKQALHRALLSAFRTYSALQKLFTFELDVSLATIVAPGPLDDVVFQIIEWAETGARLEELISGALAQNPRNVELRRFAVEVAITSDQAPQGRLESIVRKDVPMPPVRDLKEGMARMERAIGLVEIPEKTPAGTAFLVGPDLVLTNWHVAKLKKQTSAQAGIRFDFSGDAIAGAPSGGEFTPWADNWEVDSSDEKDLDYALVRLASPAGQSRGWLRPSSHQFSPGQILFILQHASAGPLRLGAGAVTAINLLHQRVTYTANTEPGSSGSPVFTLDWKPVAIHHYGQDTGNMGIPLAAIWQRAGSKIPLAAGAG